MNYAIGTFILIMAGWIFSLCLHEYAHARVAYAGGDTSVKDKGYLSFDPLKYMDPLLSIVLPVLFLIIGGMPLPGGAVYIDTNRLKSRWWDSAVSAAGPLSNLLVAIIISIILRFAPANAEGFWPALAFLGFLQIAAFLFNLIPLPPFDGFGMLAFLYTREQRMQANMLGRYIMYIIFLLFWRFEPLKEAFIYAVSKICLAIGIHPFLIYQGSQQFSALLPWTR